MSIIAKAAQPSTSPRELEDIIEAMFFAYRDFTGDADLILDELGFGRAHHRVLHFVERWPGLTVAELLELLRITKQSLARVLKQLVETGHITQRLEAHDRRHRHLHLTDKGADLITRLRAPQMVRIERALRTTGADPEAIGAFLRAMSDRPGR